MHRLKLCSQIREAKLIENQAITCSIGVAEIEGDNISELFKMADSALARAKQTGRNRSVIAQRKKEGGKSTT
jgi:diguanylate cyclase (GGDEF)-like protein